MVTDVSLPRAIYIGGAGRSGSTALEMAIAGRGSVVPLGELRNGWRFGVIEDGLCSCGAAHSECEFWVEVLAKAMVDEPVTAARQAVDIQQSGLRLRRAIRPGLERLLKSDPELQSYANQIVSIYRAATNVSMRTTVSDSSKHPGEARLLRSVLGQNLTIVLLIRDPREVIAAQRAATPQVGNTEARMMSSTTPFMSAVTWLIYNLGSLLARPDAVVFYEDFCDDPDETVRNILAISETGIASDFDQDQGHLIWGNRSRFRRSSHQDVQRKRRQVDPIDRIAGALPSILYRFLYRTYGGTNDRHA